MGSFKTVTSSFKTEAPVYLSHIAALLVPGRRARSHEVMADELAQVGSIDGWSDDDLDLLIDEGRRCMDDQRNRFAQIRSTAQVVLPVATALLVIFGSELRAVIAEPTNWVRYLMYAAWVVGTGLVLLSALGAGAMLVVRSEFGTIMPPVLSREAPPIRQALARAYTKQVPIGETTCGTRLTVIRDAVTLLAFGGLVHLSLWLAQVL